MIDLPLRTLVNAGVEDIILVTGGNRPGTFLEYLGSGKQLGIKRLYYTYQEGNRGVVDALKLARPFMESNEGCVVILGDNYFEDNVLPYIREWSRNPVGARILLKKTEFPWHFGIAEVEGGKVVSLTEKPANPKSDLAITGCYLFDHQVWNYVDRVEASWRGELEIPDLLQFYLDSEQLTWAELGGYWGDMGTFRSWNEVSQRIAKLNR
jgi:glucose-1-phosphate thymidylyltransferase